MTSLQYLLSDPLLYALLLALWLGKLYLERRVNAGVDARFAERLEAHKQGLNLLTEQAKFDLQRRLADFSLFATRKHDAAAKVWEASRVAHGYVTSLFGVSHDYTFEEFNLEDMRAHLEAKGVPKGKQKEVLAQWPKNRSEAVKELRPYLRMLRVQEADRKFQEAKNVTYVNELYFPDEVISAFNGIIAEMAEWLSHAEFSAGAGEERWRPDRKRLDASLDQLHLVLRQYVSAGAEELTSAKPLK